MTGKEVQDYNNFEVRHASAIALQDLLLKNVDQSYMRAMSMTEEEQRKIENSFDKSSIFDAIFGV